MNPFVSFMQTPAGRVGRIVVGLALIGAGIIGVGGAMGYLLAMVGVIPLACSTSVSWHRSSGSRSAERRSAR
jgi:hypothetical protein